MTRRTDDQPDGRPPEVASEVDRVDDVASPVARADGDGAEPDEDDPFAPIEASPRLATPLALVGMLLGIVAAFGGLAPLAGPVGMGVALVAHVKGSRLGLPAAGVAAVGMIVGMAVAMYLR